jgi:hypothetical protein
MGNAVFPGGNLQSLMKIPLLNNARSLDLVRWIVELSGYTTSIMDSIGLMIILALGCARQVTSGGNLWI